ncbi:VWA domain-containing protein [Thermodesulfobacteriota bacterium]
MKKIIYTQWDGSQLPFSLNRKEIVDRFMENIMKGMSPGMSLSEMFRSGFSLAGMDFRVMGLEEMVQLLQKQKDDLFSQYNLDQSFERPMDELRELLSQEYMTRMERGAERPPLYDDLPPGLIEKLKSLDGFDFLNQNSKEMLDYWKGRQNDIQELYEFYAQYAQKFKGQEFLDFDQALELMRQLKALENLQRQIMTGGLSKINPEDLRHMLGEEAQRSLNILLQLPSMISEEGIVDISRGVLDMTPKGMRSLAELAFGKVFEQLKRDRQGRHQGNAPQAGEILPDSSRPYEYGDRFDLDITKTILTAVSQNPNLQGSIELNPDDFHVREREQLCTSTTVVLLDLSWSMSWEGRFEAGKKVALALDHYVKTRFPKDKLHIIGFSTEARELKGKELSLAVWDTVEPYTNLQSGLRLAMKFIKKGGNRNNRVIIITDGQPTAYYRGHHLHVELPNNMFGLSPNACKATLGEVRKVTAQGMNIDTFMLDNNPVLVEFTREISRINGGRAVICLPGELGKLVFVEEIKRRTGRR